MFILNRFLCFTIYNEPQSILTKYIFEENISVNVYMGQIVQFVPYKSIYTVSQRFLEKKISFQSILHPPSDILTIKPTDLHLQL